MNFAKRVLSTAATAVALMAASQAQAVTTWNFSYTGAGVTASGSFTTAGNAAVAEDILSIRGTRNGATITGLVPLDTDPDFLYDNQFTSAVPHFTEGGLVYSVAGLGNVNVYFFEGAMTDLRVVNGNPIEITPINFNVAVAPVPEAATLAYMALGLGGVGLALRRKRRGDVPASQPLAA